MTSRNGLALSKPHQSLKVKEHKPSTGRLQSQHQLSKDCCLLTSLQALCYRQGLNLIQCITECLAQDLTNKKDQKNPQKNPTTNNLKIPKSSVEKTNKTDHVLSTDHPSTRPQGPKYYSPHNWKTETIILSAIIY